MSKIISIVLKKWRATYNYLTTPNDSLLIVSLVFLFDIVNANTSNGNNGSICIHGVTANGMTMREASSDQEQTTSAMTSMTSQYCPRHHHHTQQQQQAPQQQQQQQRQTPSPNKRHRLTPRPHNIQRPCLDFEKMQQVINYL